MLMDLPRSLQRQDEAPALAKGPLLTFCRIPDVRVGLR